ncbi:Biopolymer transport protein ExbD/TolR [plant metagenome]|jgi:biopolymer transport protein ExbD|uniref:Biopolymer transport protein ExbD/TolR n=2 Tax=root TaxID=1 RepID=A0A1C3K0B5_9BURK|nr:biopolymer transporter ExbD [Orrella dioscoreae]SBT24942.1 Biopolymer transport protein ExbD/TolR [Orrella dioscoreae]SOE51079.1 Biopolymer transport protein ExbD/TolR [Orrella dioscoreae]
MASVSNMDDDDATVDGINVTPLVDVLMVVLVMFILTATAQISGIQVNLPKASSSVSLSQPKTKAISINEAGQVFLDAYPVTLPELEDRLRTEKALNPDFPVIVRGDAIVQYQKVVEVLDLMRRLELSQVGLVTGKAN